MFRVIKRLIVLTDNYSVLVFLDLYVLVCNCVSLFFILSSYLAIAVCMVFSHGHDLGGISCFISH